MKHALLVTIAAIALAVAVALVAGSPAPQAPEPRWTPLTAGPAVPITLNP